jgi:hypothetical protein
LHSIHASSGSTLSVPADGSADRIERAVEARCTSKKTVRFARPEDCMADYANPGILVTTDRLRNTDDPRSIVESDGT